MDLRMIPFQIISYKIIDTGISAAESGTAKAMLWNHTHRSESQIFLPIFQFQIKYLHGHLQMEQDAAYSPVEKLYFQMLFQRIDLLHDGSRRKIELPCGLGKAAQIGNGNKDIKCRIIHRATS